MLQTLSEVPVAKQILDRYGIVNEQLLKITGRLYEHLDKVRGSLPESVKESPMPENQYMGFIGMLETYERSISGSANTLDNFLDELFIYI